MGVFAPLLNSTFTTQNSAPQGTKVCLIKVFPTKTEFSELLSKYCVSRLIKKSS